MFNLFFSLDWRLQMCSTKIYCLSKFSWILFFMSTRRQTCWREKFRLFSKAPSHLGLQLGWTVSPSGKGNCTAVSKGRVCSCCSQSDIWWMQLKHTHYKLCFWGNLHFSDLQPQPEEVLWFLAFWTTKLHCCGWYVKAWICCSPLVCGDWSGKGKRSLTRSNMRNSIACCETGGPCSYSYLWSERQLYVWLRQDTISSGPWVTCTTVLPHQMAVSSWSWSSWLLGPGDLVPFLDASNKMMPPLKAPWIWRCPDIDANGRCGRRVFFFFSLLFFFFFLSFPETLRKRTKKDFPSWFCRWRHITRGFVVQTAQTDKGCYGTVC